MLLVSFIHVGEAGRYHGIARNRSVSPVLGRRGLVINGRPDTIGEGIPVTGPPR